jgi:hypothetical protein
MACAIRGNNDIKGIKLPGEPGGKELEAKISMFADDTQLFNKDERSVEKSFNILSKYAFVRKFSAFPNLYTIFHSINNVLPNFISVNIVTMMYPQSFYIFFGP